MPAKAKANSQLAYRKQAGNRHALGSLCPSFGAVKRAAAMSIGKPAIVALPARKRIFWSLWLPGTLPLCDGSSIKEAGPLRLW